jgi:hypothetical protein
VIFDLLIGYTLSKVSGSEYITHGRRETTRKNWRAPC